MPEETLLERKIDSLRNETLHCQRNQVAVRANQFLASDFISSLRSNNEKGFAEEGL